MFRRNFISRLALGSAATLGTVRAAGSKTVTYKIKGFTCVTCSVGLDTILQRQEGVIQSKSNFPDATTTIEYRLGQITEQAIKSLISEMGFEVN
jgi:Cu+-exporting ATPase